MAFTLDELYNMQDGNEKNADQNAPQAVEQNDAHFQSGPTASDQPEAAEEATPVAVVVDDTHAKRVKELEAELQEAFAERDVLRDKLSDAKEHEADPFQEEMIELLRNEVTQLQTEVTERDTLLREYKDGPAEGTPEPGVSSEEAEKLCARLEELLEELDGKDQEVTVLQKQLQCAEDANHAEQNERRQLENWVSEIEARITARDREWEESLSEMQMRLTQARAERREAEASAGSASNDTRVEALQRVVTDLRDEKDALTQQLDEQRETTRRLESQVETAKEDASREESVELCQERAEIARQRFELERLRQEMEEQKAVEGSDLRIRALRDHLKEVQQSEEQQKREAYETSLAGRISRLWRRIEDR